MPMKIKTPTLSHVRTALAVMTAAIVITACSRGPGPAPEAAPVPAATKPVAFDPGGMTSMRVLPVGQRHNKPADVSLAAFPTELVDADRTHYLLRGMPTILILAPANPKARALKSAKLVLELPETVRLASANAYLNWRMLQREKIERDGKPYERYTLPCGIHPTTFPQGPARCGPWYERNRPPAVWLLTDQAPGAKPGSAYYRVRYIEEGAEKEMDSAEGFVHLAILDPLESPQPKLAHCGIMGRFIYNGTTEDAGMQTALADMLVRLGFDYSIGHVPLPTNETRLTKGVEIAVQNAFTVSGPTNRPEEIRYRTPGKEKEFSSAVSAWAIYRRHPWVVENAFEPMRKAIATRQVTLLFSNWEPWVFLDNNDHNPRTMEEFIAWSKLPAEEVKVGWPDGVAKSHAKLWRQFRNWEIGQIVRTLVEAIESANLESGAAARLALGMGNDPMWGTLDDISMSIRDWGDMPYLIQTWQYKDVQSAGGKFPLTEACGHAQAIRSAALAHHLDSLFGCKRKIELGCLYGWNQTGGDGYFVPEQLGFLELSGIFAGARNAQTYPEWTIFDGRYAREIARAHARIARWEDMIMQGERRRRHTVVPISPYPYSRPDDCKPEDQPFNDIGEMPDYLLSYEYRKDGKRLMLVANTWDFGDCFFKIRVFDADPAQTYALTEPEEGRIFANDQVRTILTAEDLRRGILAHVGATRWGAFLLEPNAGGCRQENVVVTPAAVMKAAEARKDFLADAVELAHRRYRENFDRLPEGNLGTGKHGETVVASENPEDGARIGLGYPMGAKGLGDTLRASIVSSDKGKSLLVADHEPRSTLTVDATWPGSTRGEFGFDIRFDEIGPMSMTLLGPLLGIGIVNETQWKEISAAPYAPRFLLYSYPAINAVGGQVKRENTGMIVEPKRWYRITFRWDQGAQPRRVDILIDGKPVREGIEFPRQEGVYGFRWHTAYEGGTAGDPPCVFLVDNLKALDLPPK